MVSWRLYPNAPCPVNNEVEGVWSWEGQGPPENDIQLEETE